MLERIRGVLQFSLPPSQEDDVRYDVQGQAAGTSNEQEERQIRENVEDQITDGPVRADSERSHTNCENSQQPWAREKGNIHICANIRATPPSAIQYQPRLSAIQLGTTKDVSDAILQKNCVTKNDNKADPNDLADRKGKTGTGQSHQVIPLVVPIRLGHAIAFDGRLTINLGPFGSRRGSRNCLEKYGEAWHPPNGRARSEKKAK